MKKRTLTLLFTLFLLTAPNVLANDGVIHTGRTEGVITTEANDGTISTWFTDGIILPW